MGSSISKGQLSEYREVVKDRIPEDAVQFLYTKFMTAAPDGVMTPALFKRYIESTGVFKSKKITEQMGSQYRQHMLESPAVLMSQGHRSSKTSGGERVEGAEAAMGDDYVHLFRGYDLDGDGVITFKEYLVYHLAIMYSTEELFYVIFASYDDNGDGYLCVNDIRAVITAATRYVGDYDVRDREVQRVIDEEARRLVGFLDIRQQGLIEKEDMRLVVQKYPQVLDKMKNLM